MCGLFQRAYTSLSASTNRDRVAISIATCEKFAELFPNLLPGYTNVNNFRHVMHNLQPPQAAVRWAARVLEVQGRGQLYD